MEKGTEVISDIEFIAWLIARLQYFHAYNTNNNIIVRLNLIKDKLSIYQRTYSQEDLDKIISKYFVDFYLTRDDTTSIGYTDQERNDLRKAIKQIIADVLLKNVPKEILLK